MTMNKINRYALALFLAITMMACQEDEAILPTSMSLRPLPELLTQSRWELSQTSVQGSDFPQAEIILDQCAIAIWQFDASEFTVYSPFNQETAPEVCDEAPYRVTQSYQLDGDQIVLRGIRQEFVTDWANRGFTVTNLRAIPLSNQEILVTYQIQENKPEAIQAERRSIRLVQTLTAAQ